jgi:hypothetical protein
LNRPLGIGTVRVVGFVALVVEQVLRVRLGGAFLVGIIRFGFGSPVLIGVD